MKRENKQARRARLLGVNHKQTNQAKFRCQVNLINYNQASCDKNAYEKLF